MAKQTYLAFLLRLWRVDGGGEATWRASLEDAHSGERRGFSDLSALQVFLQALLETQQAERAGCAPGEALEAAARPPATEKQA
jgi:hypothetical protein